MTVGPDQFLRIMFAGTAGPVFVCSLPNVKGDRPGERWLATRNTAAVKKFLAQWNVAGRATYFCSATLKPQTDWIAREPGCSPRCEENIGEIVGLHCDIDFKNVTITPAEVLRLLKSLRCPPTIIVNSGHGLHGYWLFQAPIETGLGREITNRIITARMKLAAILAGDAVQDLPRLMRLPGSHNTKDGASIEVTVEEPAGERRYDLEQMEAWLAAQRPLLDRIGGNLKPNGSGARMPPEHWLELVTGGAPDGNRNVQTARLAGHLLRRYVDPRIALGLIQCWNIAACKPPLDTKEIVGIVDRIAPQRAGAEKISMTDDTNNIVALAAFQDQQQTDPELITEDAVAVVFAEKHRDVLRFDHDIGKWFHWNGRVWICERTKLAFSWAREIARDMAEGEKAKVRAIAGKVSFAAGVERYAQADRAFAVTSEIWDRDLYLLGTPNGTVDLRTGGLRAPQAGDYISKQTAVAPADKADCPLWIKFLNEATNGDQGMIDFLQQFSGYACTGDTKEHKLVFAHGPGGNGKGTFQNTIGGILADYRRTAAMHTFTAAHSDQHPTDLAMLRGARLVTASETEEGRAWAESRIKQITGGDDITARFMRQNFFTYKPQFKLLLIGNHKPTLRNVDDAARRRFNMVPFIYKPPVKDLDLEKKLVAEWPSILRWMIEGCLKWQQDRLIQPPSVFEATEEYFSEQDVIQQWIDERCDTTKKTACDSSTNLFKSWSAYAIAHGEKPGNTKWFKSALERLGFKPFRTMKQRGFLGIEALPEPAAKHWTDEL
jgi:putative DNA primase/helicase